MIKAVLFDLDGTLLNRSETLMDFISVQYERFRDSFQNVSKEVYSNDFIKLDCNGYVRKDVVYQKLLNRFQITDIALEILLEDYLENFYQHCIPFPNMKKTLNC